MINGRLYVLDGDFAEWAFGDAWKRFLSFDLEPVDLVDAWNKLHGNALTIYAAGNIQDDVRKMKQLYNKAMAMDKKIHKITESMRRAEKDVKAGKKGAAVKVLKGAEKRNEALKREDRDIRDPLIDKAKKAKKELCK